MIIVDKFLHDLQKNGRKIRVGLWGAGEMAKGLVNQIMRYTPGMEICVIANRTIQHAVEAYEYVGYKPQICSTIDELESCIETSSVAVTTEAHLLSELDQIDILVECTGTISHAAHLILKAIRDKKHVLMFNPELDATIGPILKVYADEAGVMLSGSDGDQPGVIMNLFRFVKGIGLTPLVCGNIKGLQDFYRTPSTQASFAARWNLTPEMVTQFADGTKISIEQACVANATGMRILKRGMSGIHYDGHVDEMTKMFDVEQLKEMGGVVDYVVGAKPGPGVFIFATTDDPKTKHYLEYGKLGTGPLYCFYTPYHLIYFEIPFSIARMVLFHDVIMAPLGAPVVEVITHAKTNLRAGTVLDGLGGYHTYGQCENSEVVQSEGILPVGLAEGAVLNRDVAKDQVITFSDVTLPTNSLPHRLYREQQQYFSKASVELTV